MPQFAWKEGGNLICFKKRGYPERGGGGFNPGGNCGFIIVSYCSPNQTTPQFDHFLSYFEELFDDVHIFQPAFTYIHHFITVNDWLHNFD